MLWREKAVKARILTLKNLTDKSKSKAEWPAGSATLKWPSKVNLTDGARYLLRMKGSRAVRKIKLHLVPGDLSSDAHRAVWMARNGCENRPCGCSPGSADRPPTRPKSALDSANRASPSRALLRPRLSAIIRHRIRIKTSE